MPRTNAQARASPVKVNTQQTRRETLDGREHLVVPVIALVEGIVNGELALASEFARYPDAWNGRPVTIQHPTTPDGTPVTANQPEVLETSTVGMLFNTRRDNDRLMTEAWIDLAKARNLGGEAWEAVQALEAGTPTEVSTGYFTHVDPTTGERNGEAYSGVQYGVVPDHLALLPGAVGACSWTDGCGAPRLNQVQEVERVTSHDKPGFWGRLKNFIARDAREPKNNDASQNEVFQALEVALTEATGDFWSYIIRDIFESDGLVVYQLAGGTGGFSGDLLRAPFTFDEATMTAEVGEPEQVVGRTVYEAVPTTNEDDPDAEPTAEPVADPEPTIAEPPATEEPATNAREGEEMNELVQSLITNEATPWTEDDRAFLEGKPEAFLQGLVPAQNQDDGDGEEPTTNEGQPEQQLDVDQTLEQLGVIATPEAQRVIQNAVEQDRARRAALIDSLKANKANPFPEAELTAMTTERLEQLTSSLTPVDFSGAGLPRQLGQEEGVPPSPPVVMADLKGAN